ncbi:hypothetical protein AWH48_11510 [Domibacillus aminovorans]|uniref:Phage portal protein n=1 Tax=Domibacillus aminovorans TaxID=29332 RepID=A0A177KKG5_9BACI|nr:phage portal protein [Domibacillus aminovorans]OAH53888.1 hypothetical protein AWH48_11510 [Domibacillus aminovorans]
MFRLDEDREVTPELIQKLIEKHDTKRELKLRQYYDGEHDILKRKFEDETKPNNKIVTNFCQYITNLSVGYFTGKPVSYSASQKQEAAYMEKMQEIFDLNDEQQVNASLAQSTSIYGKGVEILYTTTGLNNELEIRFCELDLIEQNIILAYDRSVEKKLVLAIRYFKNKDILDDKETIQTFVYTSNTISHYIDTDEGYQLKSEEDHYFQEVPINVYWNKEEDGKGDFEDIITLNDAYNLLQSDDINESNYSNDAYLVFKGLSPDAEDIQAMKERRAIEVDGEGEVKWLIKDINDTWKENLKSRLVSDIHRISGTPDLSDDSFGGNQTGESMKYKLKAFEDNRAMKERWFKQGLQRRIRLITNILNIQGHMYDWRSIVPAFSANLPKADLSVDEMIKLTATGILSKDTVRSKVSIIEDPADEAEKIEKQDADYIRLNVDNQPMNPSESKEVQSDARAI